MIHKSKGEYNILVVLKHPLNIENWIVYVFLIVLTNYTDFPGLSLIFFVKFEPLVDF